MVKFNNLSIKFNQVRTGLVGDNGVGKTTLLRLIINELTPESGLITSNISISYVAQMIKKSDDVKVMDVLDIRKKLEALERINQGSTDVDDYDLIGTDWDVKERALDALAQLHLSPITLDQYYWQLSGGQKTKVKLAKILITKKDFILFDEPTNNLDKQTREFLYHFIENAQKGMIVVSHNRQLLNLMDEIVELTTKGIKKYGGNYTFYKTQSALEKKAFEQELSDAKVKLISRQRMAQANKEKHMQKHSRGRKAFLKGNIDRLTANSKQGRSERTASRMAKQSDKELEQAKSELDILKSKVEIIHDFDFELNKTYVPSSKMILSIEGLNYHYPQSEKNIFENFNFTMFGPKRIAFIGPNGVGKSTLLKLIIKDLEPVSGAIEIGVSGCAYLDQTVSLLNPEQTIIENFQRINPGMSDFESYSALAAFKFRNLAAKQLVRDLSGGERIRSGLACTLMGQNPPQLLILDEPTNHLDISSIETVENALNAYLGAILIVSHDEVFLENICVEQRIKIN